MSTETKFNKRVYGCAIIKSSNANYNADFTKQPRTLPNGIVYATDKALKYTIRHFLYKNYSNDKVLYFTRNKVTTEAGQFVPMSLKELYVLLFGELEKVTKSTGSPKWMFYYFDGEKVEGALQKITPSKIKTYYKDKEGFQDASLLDSCSKEANEKIKLNDGKLEGVEISDGTEPFYFYIKGEKEIIKIDIEEIDDIIKDLDLQFFGGYNKIKILYNLLNCIDVRLFGATYTGDTNVSIHGPVQINHGVDKFIHKDSGVNTIYTEQIKSPVRNDKAKGGDAEMTTIGSSSKTMEAHYVHNFSINPKNLDDHVAIANELLKSEEKDKYSELSGLKTDDVKKLKQALQCGATLYDSTSKAGVENELLIWIELTDDSKQVIPNLTELISITKGDSGKTSIDLTEVGKLLKQEHIASQVENVNLYFNEIYTEIKGIEKDNKVNFYPIELTES